MQPKLEKTESTETVNASEESGEEVSKAIILVEVKWSLSLSQWHSTATD